MKTPTQKSIYHFGRYVGVSHFIWWRCMSSEFSAEKNCEHKAWKKQDHRPACTDMICAVVYEGADVAWVRGSILHPKGEYTWWCCSMIQRSVYQMADIRMRRWYLRRPFDSVMTHIFNCMWQPELRLSLKGWSTQNTKEKKLWLVVSNFTYYYNVWLYCHSSSFVYTSIHLQIH